MWPGQTLKAHSALGEVRLDKRVEKGRRIRLWGQCSQWQRKTKSRRPSLGWPSTQALSRHTPPVTVSVTEATGPGLCHLTMLMLFWHRAAHQWDKRRSKGNFAPAVTIHLAPTLSSHVMGSTFEWQHAGCSPRAHKSLLVKRGSVLTGSDTRIPDCCSCQGLPLGHTHAEPGIHRRTLARGIPRKHSWTFSICRKQIYCGVLRTGLSPYSSSAVYWMLMFFIIFQDLLCHSEAKEHATLTF